MTDTGRRIGQLAARCGQRGDANARRRADIHGRDDRFRYDIGDSELSEKHKSGLYADDPYGITRQILRDTGSGRLPVRRRQQSVSTPPGMAGDSYRFRDADFAGRRCEVLPAPVTVDAVP